MLQIIGHASDVVVLAILFGITIFVHEFGHFITALRAKLVIDTFSIGFGPAIWKRRIHGILFKIGCIPVGGYVALPQLDPAGMERVQGDNATGEERVLPPASPGRRIWVSLAGAAGNMVLAAILAVVIWLSPDAITYKGAPVLGAVEADSQAYAAGLREGDTILAVNGRTVGTWYDFSVELLLDGEKGTVNLAVESDGAARTVELPLVKDETTGLPTVPGLRRQPIPCVISAVSPDGSAREAGLRANDIVVEFDGIPVTGAADLVTLVRGRQDRTVPITVKRNGKSLTVDVTPRYNAEHDTALIGVQLADVIMPWMQERSPLAQLRSDAMGIVRLLKALVTPGESRQAAQGLGGPVMILATLWRAIQISMLNAVGFLRFLNVNLAILNLLPIPVLDGGHILFALWEAATRRKVNARFANALVNFFAVLLIGAILVLTFRDVDRFFGFRRMFRRSDGASVTNVVEDVSQAEQRDATEGSNP